MITCGSGLIYRRVWLSAPLLFSLVGTVSFAQTVKIRLVNTANGDSIRHETVFVSGISGKANTQEEERQKLLSKHAAPDLVVRFNSATLISGESARPKTPRPKVAQSRTSSSRSSISTIKA